jgi:UDP-N-acetylglucosamine:LPS N-acetylglucosamine transferase
MKFCKKNKPDLIISTYFMYNSSIEQYCQENKVPFINILPDPYSVHPMTISKKATFNAMFDKQQEINCAKMMKANYTHTGWFVRPQFEEKYDKNAVRKELGLQPDTLTFLIASGSEGSNFVSTIFPSLLSSSKKIQIVIACGNNKNLLKTVQVLSEITEKLRDQIVLIGLPFTDKIHLYMQASDLVIGKAGPNTIFESIATRTPFFAVTHIPGQEDGNLTIIKNYHLGYVQENPFKAARLLKKIMEDPTQLEEFAEPVNKLAEYNHNSKKVLLQEIDKLLN